MPPNAGWKKPSAAPKRTASTRIAREAEVPARVEREEHRHQHGAREVGADHQQPARVPVGEHAAPEQRRQHRQRLGREHEAERARLSGQVGDAPAERDDERRVADERDRLAAPQQLEVAAAECGECARRDRSPREAIVGIVLQSGDLRRRLHDRAARARPRARRATAGSVRATGSTLDPAALRRRAPRGVRDAEAASRARPRRGDLGPVHRSGSSRAWAGSATPTARRSRWRAPGSHAHFFELYDDALPTLEALRARGLKIGLLSNTARDLDAFVAHHGLSVDAVLTSRLAREDEAARDDLPAHARAARRRGATRR